MERRENISPKSRSRSWGESSSQKLGHLLISVSELVSVGNAECGALLGSTSQDREGRWEAGECCRGAPDCITERPQGAGAAEGCTAGGAHWGGPARGRVVSARGLHLWVHFEVAPCPLELCPRPLKGQPYCLGFPRVASGAEAFLRSLSPARWSLSWNEGRSQRGVWRRHGFSWLLPSFQDTQVTHTSFQ